MRVPLSWLKDFIALETDPTDRVAVGDLGRVLDSLGLVIEEIEYHPEELAGIVLAAVEEIRPIEGADKIRHIFVDAGADLGHLEIVCGAWNFEVGDVVPLAPVGVTIPTGMEISRRKMRGVESNGMLCSATELGLGEDSTGLLVLGKVGSAGLEPGRALNQVLGIFPDVVFDVAIEPNRPDALSIIGVARDLGARLALSFVVREPEVIEGELLADQLASVSSSEPQACPQIVGRVLYGLTEFSSPPLIKRRLELCGMRSISAVVDASNYAMLELGQPNHPYDLDRLDGHAIGVRFARPGEKFVTLDDTEHELEPADLVICDGGDHAVGLAGVMGGRDSGFGPGTERVLLEVAQFEPIVIGRAAARHGLRTEAMARFWRGIDPLGLDRCGDRVIELVQQSAALAGAPVPLVARGTLADRPRPYAPRRVALRVERLNALLGTNLAMSEVLSYLAPLGFLAQPSPDPLEVLVPSYRPDASREVDLIEEVARHHGYERIAARQRRSPFVGALSERQGLRRVLRRVLQGVGADEAWTSSIVDPRVEALAGSRVVPLVLNNPIVAGESILRTHLLPGLLSSLSRNENQRNGAIRLYEIGNVFRAPIGDEVAPSEREHLAVIFAESADDASSAVGLYQALCQVLRLDEQALELVQYSLSTESLALGLHPTRAGLIVSSVTGHQQVIGALGEVDPFVLEAFSLPARRIGALVLELDGLIAAPRRDLLAKPVSKQPPADIDLAFSLAETEDAARLSRVITSSAGELLESLELIDVYRGPNLEVGTRSLTYRLRFRALDRTLRDEEIGELRARVIDAVESQLPAHLRA